MEDYKWNNYHVPAFGRWDYGDDDNLPYTQCFESARTQKHHSFGRFGGYNYSYTTEVNVEDTDLYVARDLYQNEFVTPAVILVPRPRRKGKSNVKGVEKEQQKIWQKQDLGGYSYNNIKEPPSPILSPTKSKTSNKAVDQDLYKIPPQYHHVKPKRKKGFIGLFSSCLLPASLCLILD